MSNASGDTQCNQLCNVARRTSISLDFAIDINVGGYFHHACVVDATGQQILVMRQLSTIHTGNSKTDIQNACVIAHVGLHLPDALHGIGYVEQAFQQLKVLADIDNDLTRAQIPEPISDALFATMTNQHVAITGTLQPTLRVAIAQRMLYSNESINTQSRQKTSSFLTRFRRHISCHQCGGLS